MTSFLKISTVTHKKSLMYLLNMGYVRFQLRQSHFNKPVISLRFWVLHCQL